MVWPIPYACAQPYHPGHITCVSVLISVVYNLFWAHRSVSDPIPIRIAVGELFCGSQPTATTCLRWSWRFPLLDPTAIPCWWAPTRAKQLSMAATARVIWLCACVRYWPYHGDGTCVSVLISVVILRIWPNGVSQTGWRTKNKTLALIERSISKILNDYFKSFLSRLVNIWTWTAMCKSLRFNTMSAITTRFGRIENVEHLNVAFTT